MAIRNPANFSIPALLKAACARREPFRKITNALRLVNSYGDHVPGIIIEQYDRHFVIHQLPDAVETAVEQAVEFIQGQFDPDYLIIKRRQNKGGKEFDRSNTRVILSKSGPQTIVMEYGLRFQADLDDTLNTGLFLDMRKNRRLVAELCHEKEVLNCFAYTCSFGVHCRAAGAMRVVNVDISAKILEKGKANYELNNLLPQENEFVRADALRYLNGAIKRGNRFDCIIIDPPTFARHQGEVFSVAEALPRVLLSAFSILKPGGDVFVATNCSTISPSQLQSRVATGAAQAGCRIRKSVLLEQDADFPGSGTMKESHLSCLLVTTAP